MSHTAHSQAAPITQHEVQADHSSMAVGGISSGDPLSSAMAALTSGTETSIGMLDAALDMSMQLNAQLLASMQAATQAAPATGVGGKLDAYG